MTLTSISEPQFDSMEETRKINRSEYSHAYYKIDLGSKGGSFGIACHNRIVPPQITLRKGALWIGVDSTVAALDKNTGQIFLILALSSRFQSFSDQEDFMMVVCETDILLFNNTFSIRMDVGFGDVITEAKRVKNEIVIQTLGHEEKRISLR